MRLRPPEAVLILAGVFGLAVLLIPNESDAVAASAECQAGQVLVQQGELDKARSTFLDVLASDPSSLCAIEGLNSVTAAARKEKRLCAEAATLAKAGKTDEADTLYAAALRENTESSCAIAGLTPPKHTSVGRWIKDSADLLAKLLAAVGVVLVLIVGGFLLVATVINFFRRRPSLTMQSLSDTAVTDKVGPAASGLIEDQLIQLGRRSQRSRDRAFDLDLVVADVELGNDQEKLADAMSEMANVPQLQIVVALVALINALSFRPRLTAGGDLLPAGSLGNGMALALRNRKKLEARGTLWHDSVVPADGQASGEAQGAAPEKAGDPGQQPQPGPIAENDSNGGGAVNGDMAASQFYDLVLPAALWVQYAAARSLDRKVEVMTDNAESFAWVGQALDLHRRNLVYPAAVAYVMALRFDDGNVAALFNLARILQAVDGSSALVMVLLSRARASLTSRYEAFA